MTAPATLMEDGFISSPFDDAFFNSIAARAGCKDDGRSWAYGVALETYRKGEFHPNMPTFSFSRGIRGEDDACLTFILDIGPGRQMSYIYTQSKPRRLISGKQSLFPATVLLSLDQYKGKPLHYLIDAPYLPNPKIIDVKYRSHHISHFVDFVLED